MGELIKPEEIIFQVRINRVTSEFELVKTKVSLVEHMAFIQYLRNYVEANEELGKEIIKNDYDLKYPDDD